MKTTHHQTRGPRVPSFTALSLAAALPVFPALAQQATEPAAAPQAAVSVPAAPAAEPRVLSSRTVPLPDGRNLIIRQVSASPVPPPAPPPAPVVRPPLTPAQLAARAAARAARPAPLRSRVLSLNVTAYADGLTYIEWWPQRPGPPYAAWSNADFRYLSLAPDFDIVSDNTRYSIFPFGIYTPVARPGRPPPAHVPVHIPADGPGFVLVKGDPADKETINPITALHQLYKEDAAQLKAAWEAREVHRLAEAAATAARAAVPPQDIILNYTPITAGKGGAQ